MKKWFETFTRDKSPEGTRFRAGIILILLSFPIGWISTLIGARFLSSSQSWFWLAAACAVYAFSWVLLAMGVWIARKRGLVMARRLWRTITRHKNKTRASG